MLRRLTALIAVLAMLGTGAACSRSGPEAPVAAAAVQVTPPTTAAPEPPPFRQVLWAEGKKVEVFDAPDAPAPAHAMANPTHEGYPLAFLATEQAGDWFRVLLPKRPNHSTGWVRLADVRPGEHPTHRVLVELGARRLTLFNGDDVVMQEPVAIGKNATPTPPGSFFIDIIVKLRNPNTVWGPYQMSVSGFSEVLQRFAGGIGQIAIHGTNRPDLIGGSVSNGCIRMTNDAINRLAEYVQVGTPVDIVA